MTKMATSTKQVSALQKALRKDAVDYDFRPWKPGESLPTKCRRLIYNALIRTRALHSDSEEYEIEEHVAELLGVSVKSIRRVKKEIKEKGTFSAPVKKKPKSTKRFEPIRKYDEITLRAIRRLVLDFYRRKEIPTLNKVTVLINENDRLPNMSRDTVHRILHDLNFRFEKRSGKAMLIDRDDIILWRRKYLRDLRNYRLENRNIVYVNATSIGAGLAISSTTKGVSMINKIQENQEVSSTAVKLPSELADRLTILHAGGEKGFVTGCRCVFRCKKASIGYEEVNGSTFHKWFEESLLPSLPPQSVIVMDTAPYSSIVQDPFPTRYWLKAKIRQWLVDRNIEWENHMVKVELLQKVEHLKPQYQECAVDFLARQAGHVVLRLPPHHCELNPIERVWSQVKEYVASRNTTFQIKDVETLVHNALDSITPDVWQTCIQQTIRTEGDIYKLDTLMDLAVEKFLKEIHCDTSSEEESDDDMPYSSDDDMDRGSSFPESWEELCEVSIVEQEDSNH